MLPVIKPTLVWVVVLLPFVIAVTAAGDDGSGPDYARDVAPLLTKYCAGCHNDSDKEGEFSAESFASLQQGTGEKPVFLPGDAANSRMIRVLTGGEPQMPPEGEPRPTDDEIATLTNWIDAGAQGPQRAKPDRLRLVVPEIESHVDHLPITALAYSPGNNRVAIAKYGKVAIGADGSADAFETADAQIVITDLPGKVNAVHFADGGEQLVTASGVEGLGGVAALWNAADGALIKMFEGHRDILYDAELSPDGTTLATCSYDKQIILWNVETGEPLRTLEGHNGAIFDVAFHPSGRFLVSASADETCKVWRVSDGMRLDTLGQPLKEQYTCLFSPDGEMIVAGGADNRIRVWRFVSTDRPRINPLVHARFAHEGAVLRVAFTADGTRLISVADDKTLKLWDTHDFTELRLWEHQPDVAAALAIDDARGAFLVGRFDGSVERLPITAAERSTPIASQAAQPLPAVVPEEVAISQHSESEPNETPATANPIDAPATVTGLLYRESDHREADQGADASDTAADFTASADFDLFRFSSLAGQEWVIEVDAARSKSPVDSFIEVLTSEGERIERVLLQAVRDSYFTFRGKNADQSNDFRLFNWEEMTLNQYLYAGGEVVKLWMYPRGPDSGYNVYPGQGNRWGFFDTTPLAHALGEPCFIVRPHPPGAELIPNGLPVFTHYYENDDESRRTLGTDSRLFFTAPVEGQYLVKVKDVRGQQGADFAYSLTVRPRQPDFRVSVVEDKLTVSPGSAQEFRVKAERIDGYDGPIDVEITGLPECFDVTSPVTIEAGQIEAAGVLTARADAPAISADADASSEVVATAEIGGQTVTHSAGSLGEIKLGEKPKLQVAVLAAVGGAQPTAAPADGLLEFTIAPGETVMLRVAVQRNDHDGEVSFGKEFSGRNLPHGVYVDNIGLNGLLLLSDQNEREFFITADRWVPEQSRLFHLTTGAAGGHASAPVLLHVRRPNADAQQAAR